ncbi:MAG TPA: FeoA family protein [Acidobacteriaceae bacterium]|nr:FeoA family protein [Acidobacteriaceae bacterium]
MSTTAAVTALNQAKVGDAGVVEAIDLPEEVANYLAHLGFLPGTSVEVLRRAPAGDPTVYRIDGVEVGLRNETARHIYLRITANPAPKPRPAASKGRA